MVDYPDRCPMHPGALLRDIVLPGVDLSKLEIAETLGISRTELDNILKGEAGISSTIAIGLDKLFGNGRDLWVGMQAAYDTWQDVRGPTDSRRHDGHLERRRLPS